MNDSQRRFRICSLVGAHLLLGIAMGVVALFGRRNWPVGIAIWYAGLIGSEILLLGLWVGLSGVQWWNRLLVVAIGIGWLVFMANAPMPPGSDSFWIYAFILLVSPFALVGLICWFVRLFVCQLERRDDWQPRSVASELRFSLVSIIALTVFVASLLAIGRIVREHAIGGSAVEAIVPIVFALMGAISAGMLVWACLGQGQAIVRVPVVVLGNGSLGLVFPYYLQSSPDLYLVWPALMAVIAAYTATSLIVVRSCGYRLVSIRSEIVAKMAKEITIEEVRNDLRRRPLTG